MNCYGKTILMNAVLILVLFICMSQPILAAPTAQPTLAPTQIQLSNLSIGQLQQAAEAGDPDAQYALGYMYYYGKNVPQNSAMAINWIKRAAVQGQAEAVKAIALLQPGQAAAATPVLTNAPMSTGEENTTEEETTDTVKTTNTVNPPVSNALPVKTVQSTTVKAATTTVTTVTALAKPLTTAAPPKNYYSIQLLGASRKQDLVAYSKAHQLTNQTLYYLTKRQGKDWYILLYGTYKTRAEAQAALGKLPASLRAKSPWIKSIAQAGTKVD